jgi:DNA-binding MarR family transcriptional regulator
VSPPTNPSPRAVGEEQRDFDDALDALFRAVLRANGRSVPGGTTPLTVSQFNLMTAMGSKPSTVTEVARSADVAVPTATRALAALERRGLVRRRRDGSEDGRLVTVALTPAGRTVLAEKNEWVEARRKAIFDGLTRQQRRTAAGTLRHVADGIDEL